MSDNLSDQKKDKDQSELTSKVPSSQVLTLKNSQRSSEAHKASPPQKDQTMGKDSNKKLTNDAAKDTDRHSSPVDKQSLDDQSQIQQNKVVKNEETEPQGQKGIIVSESLKKFRQDTPVFTIRSKNVTDQEHPQQKVVKQMSQGSPKDGGGQNEELKQEAEMINKNHQEQNINLNEKSQQSIKQFQKQEESFMKNQESPQKIEKQLSQNDQADEEKPISILNEIKQDEGPPEQSEKANNTPQISNREVVEDNFRAQTHKPQQQEEILQNQQIDESAINPEVAVEQANNQDQLNKSEIKELIETLQEFKKPIKLSEKVQIDQLSSQNQELLTEKDNLYDLLRQRDEEIRKLKEYIKLLEGQLRNPGSIQNSFNLADVSSIKPKSIHVADQNQKDVTIQDVLRQTKEDDKKIETWLGNFEKQLQKNQFYSPLIQQVKNPSLNDYLSRKPFSIGKLPSLKKKKLNSSLERSTEEDQVRYSSKFQNQKGKPPVDHRAQSQKPLNGRGEFDQSDEDAERQIQQIFADNEKQNFEDSQRSIRLKEYKYKPQPDYNWENQERKLSMPESTVIQGQIINHGQSPVKKYVRTLDERVEISPQRPTILAKSSVPTKSYEPQLLTQKKSYYSQAIQKQKFRQTQNNQIKGDQKYMSMGDIMNPYQNGHPSKPNQMISPKFNEPRHQAGTLFNGL